MLLTTVLLGQTTPLDVKRKQVFPVEDYCPATTYTTILPTLSNFKKMLFMSPTELDKTMKAYGYIASHQGNGIILYTNGNICATLAEFKSWIYYKIASGSIIMIIDDDSPVLREAASNFYIEMRPYYVRLGARDAWSIDVDDKYIIGIASDNMSMSAIGLNALLIEKD